MLGDGRILVARPGQRLSGNPTGAGDAATAAVAAGLMTSRGWPDLLRDAVAWSGAAVLSRWPVPCTGGTSSVARGHDRESRLTLVRLDVVLAEADREGGAVGAFNVVHLENAEALVAAASTGLPVVLQISENCVRYHGALAPIALATKAAA